MHETQLTSFTQEWTIAEPAVMAYVRAIVRDPHLAKDIVQATALVLCQKFEQWDSDREFLPWALGFAKTQLLAHRRDSGRCRIVFDDSLIDAITSAWPHATAEVQPEQAPLRECLDSLPRQSRQMIQYRYYDDLSHTEVAEQMGSTPGAVRIALMRIRRTLFECVTRRLTEQERET